MKKYLEHFQNYNKVQVIETSSEVQSSKVSGKHQASLILASYRVVLRSRNVHSLCKF